jgi:hypothetical protein
MIAPQYDAEDIFFMSNDGEESEIATKNSGTYFDAQDNIGNVLNLAANEAEQSVDLVKQPWFSGNELEPASKPCSKVKLDKTKFQWQGRKNVQKLEVIKFFPKVAGKGSATFDSDIDPFIGKVVAID